MAKKKAKTVPAKIDGGAAPGEPTHAQKIIRMVRLRERVKCLGEIADITQTAREAAAMALLALEASLGIKPARKTTVEDELKHASEKA